MTTSTRRPALTLMELLVVMAIIFVLFGMVLAAILAFWGRGADLKTQGEILRMDGALKTSALRAYGAYPPSQIKLCEKLSDYGNSELDQRSLAFLKSAFTGIDAPTAAWSTSFVDWDGDGAYSPPVVLTGDQCLVFFLGGIPQQLSLGVRGFGPNSNPGAAPLGRPLFNFKADRLVKVRGTNFYSYVDPSSRKRPYAYFSSTNTYNSWPTLAGAYSCDCPDLPGAAMGGNDVWPYQSAPGTFHNPNSFQIIAAGKDGTFGPGDTILVPSAGAALPVEAQDDRTNFSATILRGF